MKDVNIPRILHTFFFNNKCTLTLSISHRSVGKYARIKQDCFLKSEKNTTLIKKQYSTNNERHDTRT